MKNIKVLVAYHKLDEAISSSVYQPIQLGRSLAGMESKDGRLSDADKAEMKKKFIGDDTGENISSLNRSFNEMTAIYWAWKNYSSLGNPDYIGLTHYRRHFIFSDEKLMEPEWLPNSKVFIFDCIDDRYKNLIKAEKLDRLLDDYDGVVSYLYDLKNLNPLYLSCRDRFIEMVGLDGEIYDIAIKFILDNFPDFREDVRSFQMSAKNYLCNMFVLRKDDFIEYCEFIFPVLFEIDKNNKLYSFGDNTQKRAPGFIAEWLTTIFIFHLQRKRMRKLIHCPLSFVVDTTPRNKINQQIAIERQAVIKLQILYLLRACSLNKLKLRDKRARYLKIIRESMAGRADRHSSLARLAYRGYNKISRVLERLSRFTAI